MIGDRASVVAGPLGFYANANGVVLGPRRDTKDEAFSDLDMALDFMDGCKFSGCAHAWRAIN